jgi:hypothetical protein
MMCGEQLTPVSDQLNQAVELIGRLIDRVKSLEPLYIHGKSRYYTVYCPSCCYHDEVSHYKYRKALKGELYCYCKAPMKPLDSEYKNTRVRRLEALRGLLSALNPIILSIFKEDLERWLQAKKGWVVDVHTLYRARVTISMGYYDYITVYECDTPEVLARLERAAAFRQTDKAEKFAEELERLRQATPFRAIVAVYPWELGVDRELLKKHGFAEATRIEGFKCAPCTFIEAMLVKVIA